MHRRKNQNTTRHPYRKSDDVDCGECLISGDVANGDFEIVFEHAVFSLSPDVLCHDMTVEQVDDAMGVSRVVRVVGHHDDCGAVFV